MFRLNWIYILNLDPYLILFNLFFKLISKLYMFFYWKIIVPKNLCLTLIKLIATVVPVLLFQLSFLNNSVVYFSEASSNYINTFETNGDHVNFWNVIHVTNSGWIGQLSNCENISVSVEYRIWICKIWSANFFCEKPLMVSTFKLTQNTAIIFEGYFVIPLTYFYNTKYCQDPIFNV